jgi:hypothetical protein
VAAREASAMLSAPSAASIRETLKPLPPQSTRAAVARKTLSKASAGIVSSRSRAGLSVTV